MVQCNYVGDKMGTRIVKLVWQIVLLLLALAGSVCGDVLYSNQRPSKTNAYDLGTATYEWKDLRLSGTLYFDGSALSAFIQTVLNDTTQAATQKTLGLYRNQVTIVRTGTWIWTAYYPDGTSSTSTYTGAADGSGGTLVQTALDYAYANQLNVYLTGGSRLAGDASFNVINCTTTLRFPPLDMMTVVLDTVTFNFPATIGANPGIWIDSCMGATIYGPGCQIVYCGTGDGVLFKPTLALPCDGIITISTSDFFFWVSYTDWGNSCVHIDSTNGGISNGNTFKFSEVNGGNYPVLVDTNDTVAGNSVAFNTFDFGYIHTPGSNDVTTAMVTITDTTYATGNMWFFDNIGTDPNKNAIKTGANRDLYMGSVMCSGSGAHTAITVDANGYSNQFIMARVEVGAGGTVWTDSSATRDNYLTTGNATYGLIRSIVDADTIADNGVGASAATATLTPTSNYVELTCNDADGCTMTMGETGMSEGIEVTIVNISANLCNFADSAAVQEMRGGGTIALGAYDVLKLIYIGGSWVQSAYESNN